MTNNKQDILVSISCITFNHAKFIKQCLDSFLMQKTNFKIEILIHDDASTDCTKEIIAEYVSKYPNLIFPIYQIENQWSKFDGGINPRFNYPRAKGKYIALCEGDDYWTDPLKLQKQVDFLEKNKEYSGIATNAEVIYDNTNKESHLFKENIENTDFELDDLLKSRYFHTATFLFRRKCFKPDFPTNILSGDRALFMQVACFGKIKLLPDVTAVYRKNEGGISQSVSSSQMIKDLNIAKFLKKYSFNFDLPKLQAFIAYTVFSYSTKIEKKDYFKAKIYLFYYSLFDNGKFTPLKKWWTINMNKKIIEKNKYKLKND